VGSGIRGWWARRPRGFTLLEILIVLLLLGLAFALVAPSFVSPRNKQDDAVQRLIDEARRLAVQRAGAVTLSIRADGAWTIESQGSLDMTQLKQGSIDRTAAVPMRVQVSALGACLLESMLETNGAVTLDPVHCRITRP
jgi:prepilin-type N-terminal cleavage/methylation domain-containing protein